MKITKYKVVLFVLVLTAINLWVYNKKFIAAPVSGRIMESISIVDDIHRSEVRINFSFPLRYENHFPKIKGKEIRVNFRPMTISELDFDALYQREAIGPEKTELVPLELVVFESEFLGSSLTGTGGFTENERRKKEKAMRTEDDFYLVLSFEREVVFGIHQGSDFRSIVIFVCEKEFSEESKQCLDY
jgi:hypothetical protein